MSTLSCNRLPSQGPHGYEGPTEFLIFNIASEEYAIDIQKVQELRGYQPVTYLANSPDFLKGVVNLRGVIVPIIDLRIKLGITAPRYDDFTVVIVLNIGAAVIGVVVDTVSDVVTLTPEQIKSAPDLGPTSRTSHVIGLGVLEQRTLILTDIEKLVSSVEIAMIKQLAA